MNGLLTKLALVTLILTLTGCQMNYNEAEDKKREGAEQKSLETVKDAAFLTDLWGAKDGDDNNFLLVDTTSPDGSYCFFKKITNVNWDDESSYDQAHVEFWKGKARADQVGQTLVMQLDKSESSCDGIRDISAAEAKNFLPTTGKDTQELRLDNLNFKRVKLDDSNRGTVRNVAALLLLLTQSQKGCYVNGKFVPNPNYKPSC